MGFTTTCVTGVVVVLSVIFITLKHCIENAGRCCLDCDKFEECKEGQDLNDELVYESPACKDFCEIVK